MNPFLGLLLAVACILAGGACVGIVLAALIRGVRNIFGKAQARERPQSGEAEVGPVGGSAIAPEVRATVQPPQGPLWQNHRLWEVPYEQAQRRDDLGGDFFRRERPRRTARPERSGREGDAGDWADRGRLWPY